MDVTRSEVLSRKQAACFLGIGLNTLDRLDIPRAQIRKRILFRRVTLEKWIEQQEQKGKRV